MTPELAQAIRASAQRLGINPLDLGTAISYETGGTFHPWQRGPTTKWGQHRGLIQWGEPQRRRYGVYQGMPVNAQLQAAERYLKDAGVRPGMGLLDVYSAINAGRVGRYNARDAAAGGAPGSVADKVNFQMQAHRRKAASLLGEMYGATTPRGGATQTATPSAPPPGGVAQAGPAPALQAGPAALPSLASMFPPPVEVDPMPMLAMQQGRQAQAHRAQQEQARKKALFAATPGEGLGGLYG